jgi:flavin-dependent dehydrogenase
VLKGDILIHGLGVAGATLAYLTSKLGFKVVGLDVAPYYRKACGDVVTLRSYTWELLRATGSVLTFARRFEVRVGGVEVAYLNLGPVWAVVDKPKLVNTLRSMAEAEGAKIVKGKGAPEAGSDGVVVDARGPYAHNLNESVLTVRFIAKARWDDDSALLDFDPANLGFYWVFPLGDGRINMGAGFKKVEDGGLLKALTLKYYRRLTSENAQVLDVRGAPVAVEAPVKLVEDGVYKVGEAAGLVNSTSGEGNRYAIHSAIALARAISKGRGVKGYKELLQGVLDEITLSRLLLKLVETLGPKASTKLMKSLPQEFWAYYFKGRLTRRALINILKGEPYTLILGVLRSLASSPHNIEP